MSPRTLLILVVLVVVTAGCWVLTRGSADRPSSSFIAPEGQELLAPGLEQMDKITSLTIARQSGAATVTLKDGLWRSEADDLAGGFPLDPTRIKELLRSVARFTSSEPRTANPARHKTLQLAWPDPENKARRLTVYAGEQTVADLILGKRFRVPDPNTYVRLSDSDQTYLCRGDVQEATDVAEWIPEAASRIAEDEIAWVTHDGLRLERDEAALAKADESGDTGSDGNASSESAWSATVTDPERAHRWTDSELTEARETLPNWMGTLHIEKVQRWAPGTFEALDDVHITYGLKSGGTIEVTVHRDDDGQSWVRLLAVDAQAVEVESDDLAVLASAHARSGDHVLRVSSFHFWGLNKLIEDDGELGESEEDGGGDVE